MGAQSVATLSPSVELPAQLWTVNENRKYHVLNRNAYYRLSVIFRDVTDVGQRG